MSAAEILYTFRIPYPDVIERGRLQVVKMPAYRDGALAAPTSGTLQFYQGGTAVANLITCTISGSVAQASATIPATFAYGEGYAELWSLVMPDGTTRSVRREMALCKYPLHPVVTDDDLEAEYPDLATQLGASHLQGPIDHAWGKVLRRLISRGALSYRITSPDALYDWHLNLALHLCFKSAYRGQQADRWKELYQFHLEAAKASYAEMNFTEDADDDGFADSSARKPAGTIVTLNAAPTARQRGPSARW